MLRPKNATGVCLFLCTRNVQLSISRRRWLSTETSNAAIADPTGYCRELVRKHDYEAFLVSQFYPNHVKGGYFALKAFSVRVLRSE